jgi:hypothetical protein
MHPFYNDFKDLWLSGLNQKFLNACQYRHMEVVRYLLTSKELKTNAEINTENGHALQLACEGGDLNIVKYLINSPELKEHIVINNNIDEGFLGACMIPGKKGLELVKYLLTSKELTRHADINVDDGQGFIIACNKGNLELVKYLTASPELNKHINPHSKHDLGFRLALQNAYTNEPGSMEILNYLIFELNLEKTKLITQYLDVKDDLAIQINKFFDMRDLNRELNKELILTPSNKKQCKL